MRTNFLKSVENPEPLNPTLRKVSASAGRNPGIKTEAPFNPITSSKSTNAVLSFDGMRPPSFEKGTDGVWKRFRASIGLFKAFTVLNSSSGETRFSKTSTPHLSTKAEAFSRYADSSAKSIIPFL